MKPGEVVAGRFCIERFVARGGMGDVYRAVDQQTGAAVALKRLVSSRPVFTDRMNLEARALMDLSHPAIVRYVAHESDPDRGMFLAMEWLDGVTLTERLKTRPLDIEDSLALAARVADGLGAAHARGMVHRDIKPLNLMLADGRADRPMILDFGIVRLDRWQDITGTGVGLGTPEYMAPEQARCAPEIGPPADIFALGCVLFKCVTGQTAYRGKRLEAILAKIATVASPPRVSQVTPDIPPRVDELVARLMAHDPDDRPQNGDEAAALIRAASEALRVGVEPTAQLTVPPQLTGVEQQPLAVIFAELASPDAATVPSLVLGLDPEIDGTGAAATMESSLEEEVRVMRGPSDGAKALPDVRRALEPYGARVELLLNGSIVARVSGGMAVTDLACRTARCALALHTVVPDAAIGVAIGRAIAADYGDVGPIIEDAAALVRPGTCNVYVDPLTRDALPARFEVKGDRLVREHARQRPAAEAPRKLLGRATRCVGRSRLIRQLEGLTLGCAEDGQAHAVVVVGEAGAGKSRVRAELVSRLRRGDVRVQPLAAWGDPLRAQVPYGLLGRMLRDYLELPSKDVTQRITRHLDAAGSPKDAERVALFLAELMGIPVPISDSAALRAARKDPELMADHKRRALEDWLAAECAAHPVLLIADDLHWADSTSVELLGLALKRLRDAPLFVLAFARPSLHQRFPKLGEQWRRQEIQLDNLRPGDSEALVRSALGDELPDATVAALVTRSAGNPFYLEELIRAAAAGNVERLPETVLAGVQLRIGGLPASARQILRAASIYGRTFWTAGLQALLGADSELSELERWLSLLSQQEIVERRVDTAFPGHAEWRFHHDLVRESAYEMLTDEDRVTGHRLAGQWLQDIGETEAIVLAEHFAGAGAANEAIDWYQRAAEQALERTDARGSSPLDRAALIKAAGYYRRAGEMATSTHANEQAIQFFERAAAMFGGGEPEQTARTLVALADVQARIGARDELRRTLDHADQLTAELGKPRLRIEVLLRRAEYESRGQGENALAKAMRISRSARDLANQIGAVDLEARAYSLASGILQFGGGEENGKTAIRYAEIVLRLAAKTDAAVVGLWRLGNAFLVHRNETERARELYNRAIGSATRLGNDMLIADCLANLAMVSYREWRLGDAISQTERALRTFTEVGAHNGVLGCQLNLGTFYHYVGRPTAARRLLKECLRGAGDDWVLASTCQESIAFIERAEGNEQAAQSALRAAVELVATAGAPQKQSLYLGALAVSLWATGDVARAVNCLDEAVEIGESVSPSHVALMIRMGQFDSAAQWLDHFRTAAPDPDTRLSAQLDLARILWWQNDAHAARQLCTASMQEVPREVAIYWLPASILLACIDGDSRLAIDSLVRAQLSCPHNMVEEAMLDVATLLAALPLASKEERATGQMFLEISKDVKDQGLQFRIDHLRGEIHQRLGRSTDAARCREQSRAGLARLEAELPESAQAAFAAHPWVLAIRSLRVIA